MISPASRRRVAILLVGIATMAAFIWKMLPPTEKFDLSALRETGWVVIEYGNADCPPVEETWAGWTIRVPASRYACTSTPSFDGWTQSDFRGPAGENVAERVRQKVTAHVHGCGPPVFAFFYGKDADLDAEYERRKADSTIQDPVQSLLRTRHPECAQ